MNETFCFDCNRKLTKGEARIAIQERFVCGDCTYRREQADARRDERTNVVPIVAGQRSSS